MDFLLWQGHGARVWDYTIRQLNLFTQLANERLGKCYDAERMGR
ncbi:MAG: hypothetical protein AB1705_22625 [Verrucomicrobiota bacterium]